MPVLGDVSLNSGCLPAGPAPLSASPRASSYTRPQALQMYCRNGTTTAGCPATRSGPVTLALTREYLRTRQGVAFMPASPPRSGVPSPCAGAFDAGRRVGDRHEMGLPHAPLHRRTHQVAPGTLVHQCRLRRTQAQLGPRGRGASSTSMKNSCARCRTVLRADVWRRAAHAPPDHPARPAAGRAGPPETGSHGPAGPPPPTSSRWRPCGDAHRHATLQHHEGAANACNRGFGPGRQSGCPHPRNGPADAGRRCRCPPSPRSWGIGAAATPGCVTPQQEHHLATAAGRIDRRDGAAIVVWSEVAHTTARSPLTRYPPSTGARLEKQALDLGITLHRVGQRRASPGAGRPHGPAAPCP